MSKKKVTITEKLTHVLHIDADTDEEALDKAWEQINDGRCEGSFDSNVEEEVVEET